MLSSIFPKYCLLHFSFFYIVEKETHSKFCSFVAFIVLLRADSVLGLRGRIVFFCFSFILTSIHGTYIILISPFCSPEATYLNKNISLCSSKTAIFSWANKTVLIIVLSCFDNYFFSLQSHDCYMNSCYNFDLGQHHSMFQKIRINFN